MALKDVENGWIRMDKICRRLKDNKHGVYYVLVRRWKKETLLLLSVRNQLNHVKAIYMILKQCIRKTVKFCETSEHW